MSWEQVAEGARDGENGLNSLSPSQQNDQVLIILAGLQDQALQWAQNLFGDCIISISIPSQLGDYPYSKISGKWNQFLHDFVFETTTKWHFSDCVGDNVHNLGLLLPTAAISYGIFTPLFPQHKKTKTK